jgi:hypothetical protein
MASLLVACTTPGSETNSSPAQSKSVASGMNPHPYGLVDPEAALSAIDAQIPTGQKKGWCAIVAFDVSPEGHPSNYEVIYSAPSDQFGKSVIEGLTSAQFEPTPAAYRNVLPLLNGKGNPADSFLPVECDAQGVKKGLSRAYAETHPQNVLNIQ